MMTESIRVVGNKTVDADKSGMRLTLSWKSWMAVAAFIVVGSSSYAGWRLVTCDQLQDAISASEQKQSAPVSELRAQVSKQGTQIDLLTNTIDEVQQTQHMDIANREARRVISESIKCKITDQSCTDRRDSEIERIRRSNMRRLASKPQLEPCSNLLCN